MIWHTSFASINTNIDWVPGYSNQRMLVQTETIAYLVNVTIDTLHTPLPTDITVGPIYERFYEHVIQIMWTNAQITGIWE